MRTTIFLAIALFSAAVVVHAAADEQQTIVVCSPGSPGTTDEAQPRMDALAAAVGAKAGVTLAAVYEPTDAGGVKRLETAGIGIVSLPFFLAHEKELGLHARLDVVQKGRPALERWVLVAQKGRVVKAEALGGMTIVSSSGFAPDFVKGAIAQLGAVPANVKIVQSSAVLSGLRKAAAGEPVAVLLDGPQAASIASLPFAAKLETVATSPAWPAGVVVTNEAKVPAKTWAPIQSALLGLGADRAGASVLEGLQMEHFVSLDEAALASARKAFARPQ